MATSEDEEFEFRRRAEADAAAAAPSRGPPSLLDALGRGAANLIPHSIDASMKLLGAGDAARQFGENLTNPDKRKALANALSQKANDVGSTIGGYVQQLRDLSPPEAQGSAPRMNTAPAQQAEAGVVNRLGVNVSPARVSQALQGQNLGQPNANAYNTAKTQIAEHPLSVLAMAAPFAGKAIGAGADALEGASLAVPSGAIKNAGQRIAKVLDAGATPAAENVRSAALAKVMAQQKLAEQEAAGAGAGAGSAGAMTTPAAPGIGQVRAPTDIGAPVQQAATANLGKIQAAKQAADEQLRATMQAVADEQAAKGVGVSDVAPAKALVTDLKSRLEPKGTVVTLPTPDQTKAYESIINVLSPSSQGQKPSLEALTNLRRQLSDAAYGGADPSGYAAIGKVTRQDLIGKLKAVEDAYTSGASAPVRANWRTAMQDAEQYDTKLGSALTATQGDTGIMGTAASQVPANIINKGREGYRQAVQLAGPEVAQKMVADSIETALFDPKTDAPVSYAKAIQAVGAKSKLGDILQSPDLAPLRERVVAHLKNLQDAESAQGVAKTFAQRALDAEAAARTYAAQAAQLDELPAKAAVGQARGIVDGLASKGLISDADHRDFIRLANAATDAQGKSAFRKRVALLGLGTLGVTEGGRLAAHAGGILP